MARVGIEPTTPRFSVVYPGGLSQPGYIDENRITMRNRTTSAAKPNRAFQPGLPVVTCGSGWVWATSGIFVAQTE